MYRDDVCPVCGASLPPDHLYCRAHAAEVDDRLRDIASLLRAEREATARLAALLSQIAPETWDYIAEHEPDDPLWPPAAVVEASTRPDQVQVDVDSEPGLVRVRLELTLDQLLGAVCDALSSDELARFTTACGQVEGAGATH